MGAGHRAPSPERGIELRTPGMGRERLSEMTMHRTKMIDGLKIFYREAGDASKPTLVLLHGFPTSSHMFRPLIPALAGRFHVVAPDYPGFGFSDAPSPGTFRYTFDRLAEVTEKL